jgi:hypothetical protein
LELAPYKTKAEAAGFEDPHIVATHFAKSETFESRTVIPRGVYFIQYTVLGYDRSTNSLSLGLEGRIGGVIFQRNTIMMKVVPGQITEIPKLAEGMPRIFLQILDLPSPCADNKKFFYPARLLKSHLLFYWFLR